MKRKPKSDFGYYEECHGMLVWIDESGTCNCCGRVTHAENLEELDEAGLLSEEWANHFVCDNGCLKNEQYDEYMQRLRKAVKEAKESKNETIRGV